MKHAKISIYQIIACAMVAVVISYLPVKVVFPVIIVIIGLVFGLFLRQTFLSSVFILAFLSRIIFAIFLYNLVFLNNGLGLLGDSRSYSINAVNIINLWSSGLRDLTALSIEALRLSDSGNLGSYDFWNAIVYYFAGVNPITMIFINCVVSSLTAVLIYSITKQIWNEKSAKFAACLTAFWPSTFFWSVQNLKEPLVIFLSVILLWAFIRLKKQFRFYMLLIILASTVALRYLRGFLLPLFYGVILPGSVLFSSKHKKVVLFWVVIFSAAAIVIIKLYHPNLIDPSRALKFLQQERAGRAYGNLGLATNFNIGNISNLIIFMPVFLANALLAPYPWQVGSMSQISSMPEMLLFYALIPLMFIGGKILIKNRSRESWILIFYILIIALVLSVIEGNAGTLFRHRSMILPLCFILIGVGLDKCNFRVSFHNQ